MMFNENIDICDDCSRSLKSYLCTCFPANPIYFCICLSIKQMQQAMTYSQHGQTGQSCFIMLSFDIHHIVPENDVAYPTKTFHYPTTLR